MFKVVFLILESALSKRISELERLRILSVQSKAFFTAMAHSIFSLTSEKTFVQIQAKDFILVKSVLISLIIQSEQMFNKKQEKLKSILIPFVLILIISGTVIKDAEGC